MNPLADIHAQADKAMANALSQPGCAPCCSRGCFYCCKEPAYTTKREIKYLLETMPADLMDALRKRVNEWLLKFAKGGWVRHDLPNAFAYRADNIWCPLLAKDGTCSVYDRRPMECRIFFAQGSPKGCEVDALRPKQKFANIPDTVGDIINKTFTSLEPGETETYDHIGALLGEELFGERFPTNSRITFTKGLDGQPEFTKYRIVDKSLDIDQASP